MAFRRHNEPQYGSQYDSQFDEFFGTGRNSTPPHEGYGSDSDVYHRVQYSPSGQQADSSGGGRFHSHSQSSGQRDRSASSGRSAAVKERFGGRTRGAFVPRYDIPRTSGSAAQHEPYHESRSSLPAGFNRHSGNRQNGGYPVQDNTGRRYGQEYGGNDYYPEYPEYPEQQKTGASASTVLLTVLGIVLTAAVIVLALFMLRPTDGGDYYRLTGTLPQVMELRQTQAYGGSAVLDWEPLESVSGYRIYRADSLTGQNTLVKTAYLSFAYLTGLERGSADRYVICPFCTTDSGEYMELNSASITVKTLPGEAGALAHNTATSGSITLEWSPAAGADGYIIERYLGSWLNYEVCAESQEARATVAALDTATEYTFRMRPYIDIGTKRCYGSWSDKFTSATSPAAVFDLTQGKTTDSGYELNWSVNSVSTGFELYRADPQTGQPTELLSQCGNNYYKISGLESVNYSSYCVRAFLRHSGGISYGEFSPVFTAVTLPSKVLSFDQYTSSDGDYTLSWQPSVRAEGYEIYAYSCHEQKYNLLASVTDTSYTISGLSEYAERYMVRAYASLGDLKFFGDFSDALPCYPYYYLKRTVEVDVDSTSLRTYSGPEYELIAELKRGTDARVFGERSGSDGSRWFRVELKDGTTGWLSREDVSVTNTCGTLATRDYTDEEPIIIYLSPSRQDGNLYWSGLTTEKEQMEAVGAVTHRILAQEYNCIVYTATPGLELRERAFEALELKADIYFAIHSNATGNSEVHYGASSYYCGASGRSKRLGQAVVDKLNAIAPRTCTLDKQMYSALESFGGVGYAEVRDPYNLGMVSMLAETDFHDNSLTGQWIIDNHEAIGRACAEAIAETFEIEKKNN